MISRSIDDYQFHDNLIHGFFFASDMDDFSSDIHFDIDHILEWKHCSTIEYETLFSITRALLKFHNVTDLNINITWGNSNYSEYSGYSSGVYILDIKKEKVESPLADPDYYKWTIFTSNDDYFITFGASSMSLELVGEPIQTNRQYLLNHERN